MKILQVVPYFYPAWAYGGIPRVAYELSVELVRNGHNVTVCTTDVLDRDSRCEYSGRSANVAGINVRYFRNISNRLAYDHQMFLPMGMRPFMKRAADEYDVLHMHGHRHLLNNTARHYAMVHGTPYVFSGHGTVPRIERRMTAKTVFDSFFGRKVLRDASRFIAVSQHEVEQYEAQGINGDMIDIVYNGLNVNAFNELPEKSRFKKKYGLEDSKIVLYLGKITPRKGVDFLVRAFSELEMNDAVLVIAGNDMGYKGTVQKIIREKGIEDKVLFTGLLIDEEKLEAYRDADVLVYPAIHEIFGLVPFEAIMCGTPVIVTDDCGCGEIIGREDIGYTVSYDDIPMLKEAIGKVIRDVDEAGLKVEKGKKFIRNNLDWKIICEKYTDVYRSVLK